jgi:phospholipid/cholesterol/gamma-HCH transport system substrate-binding protein
MPSRAQKIRLGIFVLISSLVLIALLAYFTSERYLQKTDNYRITYEDVSVSGLEAGSPVKYLGLKVGTIKEIAIDPDDVSRINVEVALNDGTPIKEDAVADIVSMGITGLKMIEIRGASQEAPLLPEGGQIKAGATEEITGKAEVVAEKMERVLTNLQTFTQPNNLQKIIDLVERASAATAKVDTLLSESRHDIRQTVVTTRDIAAQLDTTTLVLHASAERIRNIVYSDTLSDILVSARDISLSLKRANLEILVKELGEVVHKTNVLLARVNQDVDQGSRHFLTSLQQLRRMLSDLNETTRLIRQDPSVVVRGTNVSNLPDKNLERN